MLFTDQISAIRARVEQFDLGLKAEIHAFIDKVAHRETVEQKVSDLIALGYTVTAPTAEPAPKKRRSSSSAEDQGE